MNGIVGAVFIVTMLSCVFGLIDQAFQALKRALRDRRTRNGDVDSPVLRIESTTRWNR